jgi:hypothetical protein
MNGRQLPAERYILFGAAPHRPVFPYVYLSRDLMKIMGYQLRAYLVYRRTISRPAYEYLNPSPRVIDPYLQETGNPSLRPQFTQNYEANVSVDERPDPGQSVSMKPRTSSPRWSTSRTAASRQVAYRTYDNLGSNHEVYFRALGAIPGKKVFVVARRAVQRELLPAACTKASRFPSAAAPGRYSPTRPIRSRR